MDNPRQKAQKSDQLSPAADGAQVTFYTDPLCCWSWAMAASWDRLAAELGQGLRVQYKMGGLLPSWRHFQDGVHSITRPAQMGPEWMHAAQVSGVEINSQIWISDPPASSYPACVAVKCVQLQSERFAKTFLQLLWEAVMLEGKNIARNEVLLDASWILHDIYGDFDLFRFRDDLMGDTGKEALRRDLQDAKYLGINRFPTLVVRRSDNSTIILTGFQTYESLKAGIMPGDGDHELPAH